MFKKNERVEYDAIGPQDPIYAGAGFCTTLGVETVGGDVDLEVQLHKDGEWFVVKEAIAANWLEKDVGFIVAARLNITTLGTGDVAALTLNSGAR